MNKASLCTLVSFSFIFALSILTPEASSYDISEQSKSEYCERVAMYEEDVLHGESAPRGHRDYDNLCGG